ncbi:MAG: regulatory protein GemA [bacterium]
MKPTPKQIALVHVAKSRLGLDDDTYRDILDAYCGVTSARDLDREGFDLLMEVFAQMGFESTSAKRNYGRRPGMATTGQIAYIRRLWADYTGGEGTELSLGKWMESKFKVSALRFLTKEHGQKVIAALLNMNAKKAAKTAT